MYNFIRKYINKYKSLVTITLVWSKRKNFQIRRVQIGDVVYLLFFSVLSKNNIDRMI